MIEPERIPIERLYVGALHVTPINRDWSEGYGETWESYEAPECPECGEYGVWDKSRRAWLCPSDPQDCDHGDSSLDEDGDGPMMNYAYPIEDLGQASDLNDAANRIRDLPLCLVSFDGDCYALALTGGGMDLSWEICEAFTRLGFLPPLHFCDLPRMAGYPRDEAQYYVIDACKRSAAVERDRAIALLERLQSSYPARVAA